MNTGKCLCGAVEVSVLQMKNSFSACHCRMCRRWGGGPLFAIHCGSDVSFQGEENITTYSSSSRAERGFCKKCGTHLFYRLKTDHQHIMSVGIFDKFDAVFKAEVFIDEKPDYYSFANETTKLTGAEVFAKFKA